MSEVKKDNLEEKVQEEQNLQAQLKVTLIRKIIFMALPAIIIFYYEMIFNIGTVRNLTAGSLLNMALFSIFLGFVIYIVTSISKSPRFNKCFRVTLYAVIPVWYMIEYYAFAQFKVFLNIESIGHGGMNTVATFHNDIINLIVSVHGIVGLVLMYIPVFLYQFLLRRFEPELRLSVKRLIASAVVAAGGFAVMLLVVFNSSIYRPMYTNEYNFHTVVGNFGLANATSVDIRRIITGEGSDRGFDIVDDTDLIDDEAEEIIEYGYNSLDIDFDALIAEGGEFADLDAYVKSLAPTKKNEYTGLFKGKNLIFITGEAFCKEAIDPVLTPTLYRLATKGMHINDYYQPMSCSTTGGEYQLLMGMLPTAGGMSMEYIATHNNYQTIANQLNPFGYTGFAFHNHDDYFYARGVTHNSLGYSEGFMGMGSGMEQYVNYQWPESDVEMALGTMDLYMDKQPFNIYYITVSGHGNYEPGHPIADKNLSRVSELAASEPVKYYKAAQLEFEDFMKTLVSTLYKKGIADDTVIVVSGDHFPYGLDHYAPLGAMYYTEELYGYPINDYITRDHNALLIWSGCLENEEPIVVDDPVCAVDVLPTLCNLFGTDYDSRLLPGRDIFSGSLPIVFNLNYDWKSTIGTYIAETATFTPADPGKEVSDISIEAMKTLVRNKINYCEQVTNNDYFAHVFAGGVPTGHESVEAVSE